MKLLYLLFSFTLGGTEKLIVDMANRMVNQNCEVSICIINNQYDQFLLDQLDKRIKIIMLMRNPGSKNRLSLMFKLAKLIKEEKFDIIHCNSFNAPETLLLCKSFNRKVKIIITIHDKGQFKNLSIIRFWIKNIICDKFVAISDSVKLDLFSIGIIREKIVRIYNGIDFDKFKKYSLNEKNTDYIILGCIARIVPFKKGQDLLLRAVNILRVKYPKIKILFAGGVSKENEKEFEELRLYIKNQKMEKIVTFLGSVEDIRTVYNKIDICVLPSRFEGFGLSVVESIAMGVPVVVSDVDGPKEIIQASHIGQTFKKGDYIDLANKIEATIENLEKQRKDTKTNRNIIRNLFDINSTCEQYMNVYKELINKSKLL